MTETTTKPVQTVPPARQGTFASFSVPNYRIFFTGAIVSNIGTWMYRVAQDWLVLTILTDHSSSSLGIVTGLQFLPIPFLAPYAGSIADRFPKRRILLISQALLGLTALATFVLVATGMVELWHIYVLAFLTGVVTGRPSSARWCRNTWSAMRSG